MKETMINKKDILYNEIKQSLMNYLNNWKSQNPD